MSETKPSEGSPPSSASKETGFLEGDDSWTQWRNFFTMLLGKMPAEGQKRYWQERDKRNEVADCARCDEQKKYLLQYSPVIRYLRKNINQLGGDINETNVHCRRCEEAQGGGFSPEFGIKVCANQMTSKGMLEDTIAHEMVHAYDHLRFKLDWHDDLRHAACTEIRASSLSGECRWAREFWSRGQWKLTQQHQECVWRRAVLSVRARKNCKDDAQAAKVVNEVWDSCFRDTRPFEEIYR